MAREDETWEDVYDSAEPLNRKRKRRNKWGLGITIGFGILFLLTLGVWGAGLAGLLGPGIFAAIIPANFALTLVAFAGVVLGGILRLVNRKARNRNKFHDSVDRSVYRRNKKGAALDNAKTNAATGKLNKNADIVLSPNEKKRLFASRGEENPEVKEEKKESKEGFEGSKKLTSEQLEKINEFKDGFDQAISDDGYLISKKIKDATKGEYGIRIATEAGDVYERKFGSRIEYLLGTLSFLRTGAELAKDIGKVEFIAIEPDHKYVEQFNSPDIYQKRLDQFSKKDWVNDMIDKNEESLKKNNDAVRSSKGRGHTM